MVQPLTKITIGLAAMQAMAQLQAATLFLTMTRVGDDFAVEQELEVNPSHPRHKRMGSTPWHVDAKTLEPLFQTERFECVINNKTDVDGCMEWREREDEFIHINRFQSDYGDTRAQRDAKAAKSSTVAKVATVAGGVMVAPVVVMLSPWLLLGKAVEPETRKWVEFNHDKFNEALTKAVQKAGFEDAETYRAFASKASQEVDRIESYSTQALKELNSRVTAEKSQLQPYVKAGLKSAAYLHYVPLYKLPNVKLASNEVLNFEQEKARVDTHYNSAYEEFKKRLVEDLAALEGPYQNILAKEKQEAKERERRQYVERLEAEKQARIAQEAEAERRAKESAMLTEFRRALKVGDSTFCGYVIESRPPMVRLALNTLLAGYPSEVWVRVTEVFPPHYGCVNRNGRISAQG